MPELTDTADYYFITTPFVDAYMRSEIYIGEDSGRKIKESITFEQFLTKMRSQAYSWGEQGLGRALLRGEELPAHEGAYILAIGTFGNKGYAFVVTDHAADAYLVIEYSWPWEWDVT